MDNSVKKQNKGFTLIELLVVVALIGLLATLSMVTLNTARLKARDARRLADMDTLKSALELYYNTYGDYPPARADNGADEWSTGPTFIAGLVSSGLMKSIKDPKQKYVYNGSGLLYIYSKGQPRCLWCPGTPKATIRFYLENDMPTPGFFKPGSIDGCTMSHNYVRNLCIY